MSDYRQEGTGKVITEQQLLTLAAESDFSVEDLIQKNNLKLITEDSGNTTGAATTTANVVPKNQIADTDLTLENGLSESQDPDPKNFTKRDSLVFNIQETEKQINNYIAKGGEVNASDAAVLQGYKDELFKLDQNDLVGTNFSSDKFKKLQDDEKIKLQEAASNEIRKQYDSDGVVDFEITPEEIDSKASEILKENLIDNIDWIKQASTELKIGTQRTLGQLARIPKFINEIKSAAARDIILSEEEQKEFDNLPSDVKDMIVGSGDVSSLSSQSLAEVGEKYFKEAKSKVEELSKDLVEFDAGIGEDLIKGNIGRATARAISSAIGSLPSMAQALAGPAGIASIFAGSAAEASAKAQEEGLPLSLKTVAYASTIGASEAALELITRGIGKSVFNVLHKKPKEFAVKQLREIVLGLAKDFGKEGTSEVATEIINKAADALFLSKKDVFKDSFSELVDVFIVGGVAGGGLASIRGGAEVKQNIKAKKGINKIISTLDPKEFNDINVSFDKPLSAPVTEKQLEIAKDKNAGLGLSFILNQSVKKGEITKEQAAQSMAKFKQTQSLDNQIKKTKLDLSPTENVEVINLLSEKIDLQKQIKDVDPALVSSQKERINEIDESINETVVAASKVKLQAETKIVEKLVGKEKVKSFDTVEEFVEKTRERPDADAYIAKDGSVFINTQRAAKVGAFSAASHELLHRVIKSTFSDKAASTNLVKNFNEVLEKEGYLDVVQKRIDDNYRYNEDGSEKAFEEYAEEYLTSFSDAIATGSIEFNESKFKKFMQPIVNFLRKVGYSTIEFKDGRDVYDFIKDYRKNIEKGELSKRAQALQTKGEQVEGSVAKPSVTKFNQQLEQLETEYDDGEIDFDVYEQQKANLEGKIERAEKAEVTVAQAVKPKQKPAAKPVRTTELGPNDPISKKIMNTYNEGMEGVERKNYNDNKPLPSKLENKLIPLFEGYINTIVNQKFSQTQEEAFNKEDALSVLRVEVQKAIRTFNPKKNKDLAGYVKKFGVQARQSLMFKDVKKEFTSDVDTAKGVAISEPTALATPEKTKYKNLVQQRVLSNEGLKTVRDKVISSVRVLKSKFDAAVTKNVSVPPIIAEIKKDIGKQADIVLKKEMGGIKNNELQNYLKTNKNAILEKYDNLLFD